MYNNWDTVGSAAYDRLVAYTRHIAGTAGYSTSTNPRLAEVEAFLDDAYYEIATLLEAEGYSATQTDDDVKGFLTQFQALTTAIKVELTTPATLASPEGNVRFQALEETRRRLEALIRTDGLANLGATKSEQLSKFVVAAGVSRDRKETVEDDEDLVQARFKRGWGQHPAVLGAQYTETDVYTE